MGHALIGHSDLRDEAHNGDEQRLCLAIDALRRNPKDLDALRRCFEVYSARCDFANAEKVLEVVLGIDANLAWAHAEQAAVCFDSGRIGPAETAVRRALVVDDSSARTHAIAANVFSELNRLAAGEWHFRRALELGGPNCKNLTHLGHNLVQQGRIDEAQTVFEQAFALDPDALQMLGYFARLREIQGRFDAARQLLERANAVKAGSVSLLQARLLSRQGRHADALALIDTSPRLNGDAVLERGRLNERLARYDRAWADYVEAKRLLARESGAIRYDAGAVEDFFAALRGAFTRERMAALPRASVRRDVAQPIFIVGAPRSGTTLLERMLASHSQIAAAGELPFVGEFRDLLIRLFPERPFPHNLGALTAADCRFAADLLRDFYLARRAELAQIEASGRYVVDKMPFNEMYLPLIRLAFPACPIIHLQRHPLDIAVSMWGHKLNHGFFCAYDLDGMAHHLTAVAQLHQAYRKAFDTGEVTLRYEALVHNPEKALRGLFEALGLPFEAPLPRVPSPRISSQTAIFADAELRGRGAADNGLCGRPLPALSRSASAPGGSVRDTAGADGLPRRVGLASRHPAGKKRAGACSTRPCPCG